MGMTRAIEHAVEAALEFWKKGRTGLRWAEGPWEVSSNHCYTPPQSSLPSIPPGGEHYYWITVLGPTRTETDDRWDLSLYPTDYRPPESDPQLDLDITEFLRRSDSSRSTLTEYSKMKLFWPGLTNADKWTRCQVGIGFLQRDWLYPDEEAAWVWEECVRPVFSLSRAGREAMDDGALGYEMMWTIVDHLQNPSHPRMFQAYIQTIPRRLNAAKRKQDRTDADPGLAAVTPYWDPDRFMSFVRKRKSRGEPGIGKRDGRLVGSKEVREKLQNEWVLQESRKKFIRSTASRMVELGVTQESASRQARRWLSKAGSPDGAIKLYEKWRNSRSRRT